MGSCLSTRELNQPQNRPDVKFSDVIKDAKYELLQPYRLTIEQDGRTLEREFLPQRDTIHILIYNRRRDNFLFTRYFRPEVFASRLMQLPKNKKDTRYGYFGWSDADRASGCTLELCGDRVEVGSEKLKEEALRRKALAIVETEFGMKVDEKNLELIDSFLTGVTDSGANCHLFYAEVENSNTISCGRMEKVWLKKEWAKHVMEQKDALVHSSFYYALSWWFLTREYRETSIMTLRFSNTYEKFERQCSKKEEKEGLMTGKWRCEKSEESGRHTIWSFNCKILKTQDRYYMVARPDTVSILIKDVDSKEVVMTKRFRPALIGPLFMQGNNENDLLEEIDVSNKLKASAYAYELASGKIEDDDETDTDREKQAAKRVASLRLGYEVPLEKIELIARLLVGSSPGGESKFLFYAECTKANRAVNWNGNENGEKGIERVKLPRWSYSKYVRPHNSPPSVYIALHWMARKEPRMTEEEVNVELRQWECDIENGDSDDGANRENDEAMEVDVEDTNNEEDEEMMKREEEKKKNVEEEVNKEEDTSVLPHHLSSLDISRPPPTERREEGERLKKEKKKKRKRKSEGDSLKADQNLYLHKQGLDYEKDGIGQPRTCKTDASGKVKRYDEGSDENDENGPGVKKQKNQKRKSKSNLK